MDIVSEILLSLVRLALGTQETVEIDESFDSWNDLLDISFNQGVPFVVSDGITKAVDSNPALTSGRGCEAILDFLGNTVMAEGKYASHKRTVSELCRVFHEHGVENVLLLKGIGISRYYPVPSHRPTGDIDIYTYGKSREADEAIRSLGIQVDSKFNKKHSELFFKGVLVENHHEYLDYSRSRNERMMNDYLHTLQGDELTEDGYLVPSPEKNFWFLACHMQSHFMLPAAITLRHLLDWGLFLNAESGRLDAQALMAKAVKFRMDTFISYASSLAQRVSGLNLSPFITVRTDPRAEERLLKEILREKIELKEDASRRPLLLAKKTLFYFRYYWKFKFSGLSFQEMFWDNVLNHFKLWSIRNV